MFTMDNDLKQSDETMLSPVVDSSIFNNATRNCQDNLCDHKQRVLHALKYYQTLNMQNETDQNALMKFCYQTYTDLLNDFVHIITKHPHELDEIYNYVVNDKSIGFNKCNVLNCKLADRHNRDRQKAKTTPVYAADADVTPFQKFYHSVKGSNEFEKHAKQNEHNTLDINRQDELSESEDWVTYEEDIDNPIVYTDDENADFYDVNSKSEIEMEFIFSRDLFDAIHCYILHQYDFGLRIHKNEKNKYLHEYTENKQDHKDGVLSCRDDAFAVITKIIKTKKNILGDISRFTNNNKFLINNNDTVTDIQKEHDITFMDKLYENVNILADDLQMKRFLYEEEYDSVAMEMDILESNESSSNISQHLGESMFKACERYIIDYKISQHSFSTGFTFYYWDYYKHDHEQTDEEKIDDVFNVDDYGGYKPYELYVETRYNDIKFEILNNKIYTLTLEQFKTSLTKANKSIATRKAKQLRARDFTYYTLHYQIKPGRRLRVSNLLSIILYTDWSNLCTEFSRTFRKIKVNESLSSVKERNSEYCNWSRLLRETVEGFGEYSTDLQGNFFCGMSFVMIMPEVNIRLRGPTSTSTHIEVATRFGGEQGIIIQLQTNDFRNDTQLRGFNCSWVSNYTGEAEYLFVGGFETMRINTIKNLITAENFKVFIKPLYIFDAMINGIIVTNTEINQKRICSILENLIKHSLQNNNFRNEYPRYINFTFEKLVNSKTTLIFNYHNIKQFQNLQQILFEGFSMERPKFQQSNLFNKTVFELFKNVRQIIIYSSTQRRSTRFYPINLEALLALLCESKLNMSNNFQKIIIKATTISNMSHIGNPENYPWAKVGVSWLVNAFTPSIESQYNQQNWNIKLTKTKNAFHITSWADEDCIIISKM
eukprot:293111_1